MGNQAPGQQPGPFVSLPYFPPSANHIYVSARGSKKRFLSKEATSFKTNAISHIQAHCLAAIAQLDREALYRVWYVLYFNRDDVLTKSFGSGKKGAAESRYKRVDSQNRIKLVTDALATAIGIDDSQFWEEGITKRICPDRGTPYIDIFLTPLPTSYFF